MKKICQSARTLHLQTSIQSLFEWVLNELQFHRKHLSKILILRAQCLLSEAQHYKIVHRSEF